MEQATINPDLTVVFEHAALPSATDWEVIIKAETASINPVDWKAASRKPANDHTAPGKDFAGTVHSVGRKVFQFKVGDRVGGFNQTSGFAEYSISPSSSTFRLPDHVSFEEAASFGLPYYTAALGLFKDLPLPAPWNPAKPTDRNPLLIYGASSAVGAYSVQLAALANIHPIIAVAGAAAQDTIASTLRPDLGDILIDYRSHSTPESLIAAIEAASGGPRSIKFVYDVISTDHTINAIVAHVLSAEESYLAYASPGTPITAVPSNTRVRGVLAPGLFRPLDPEGDAGANGKNNVGSRAFASIASKYLEFALGEGLIRAQPWKVLPGGLGGLRQGLLDLKAGENKSLKYVMRIGETNWTSS